MNAADVRGTYARDYRPLVDQFANHLRSGRDSGAALSVYVDGVQQFDVLGRSRRPRSGRSLGRGDGVAY